MTAGPNTAAMARDLDLIAVVEVIGPPAAKRSARRQKAGIFAEIRAMNARDGLDEMSDTELLRELGAAE